MRRLTFLLAAALLAGPAAAAVNGGKPMPGYVRVRLDTSAGPIVVALDAKHAPRTTANFLAYVDDGRFDGTDFYRAARTKGAPTRGFVQGGVGQDARRMMDPIAHEPTSATGLHHTDGALSMARNAPGTATGNFSIMVGPNPGMDAHGKDPGYAVFGHVVSGMDVVKRILASPSGGGAGPMKGQMILRPVTIVDAKRLDGTPHPSGHAKPWLINFGR